MPDIARRSLAKLTLAGAALGAAPALAAQASPDFTPRPFPAQHEATYAVANLPDAQLAYWDTRIGRAPVVLMHPATGSYLVWSYQQPAFAAAGLRTIAYSRRGFAGSNEGNGQGSDSEDLRDLADFLRLPRFHLVGTAGGAFTALDFAVEHPERLISLTLACSIAGVDGAGMGPTRDRIRPAAFNMLPPSFQELSPSYRAANPDGTQAWEVLQQKSRSTSMPRSGRGPSKHSAQQLRALAVPTLLIAGGSDLIAPPPLMRPLARVLPNAKFVEIPDTGHSAYWEQPEVFNEVTLRHIGSV